MQTPEKVIVATFYRLGSGREPVRNWLLSLEQEDRKLIGQDIMAVEYGWPCGEPLCKSFKDHDDLREVRTNLSSKRISRVCFYVSGKEMVLLHGFIKKSQKTPKPALSLASRRLKDHKRHGTK